jgi:hypothetical protein
VCPEMSEYKNIGEISYKTRKRKDDICKNSVKQFFEKTKQQKYFYYDSR